MICVAHQYLFLNPDFKSSSVNRISKLLLNLYTRMTAIGSVKKLALSFRKMKDSEEESIIVVPPLIRDEVLNLKIRRGEYLHGYILNNGYSEEICKWHIKNPDVKMHFFRDRKSKTEDIILNDNLCFHKLDDRSFFKYMSGAKAFATTAGFESVCEAMCMGKTSYAGYRIFQHKSLPAGNHIYKHLFK